jgi:hypothetical protein
MDFQNNDIRISQSIVIGIRLTMLYFDFFCIYSSYDSIKKDRVFMHYSATIFAVSLSILNSIRYEYNYWNSAYGRNFLTKENYIVWKSQNLKNIKYFIGTIEYILKITFFYYSFPIQNLSPYSISILLLQLNIGLFIIFVKLCIIYFIYWISKTLYNNWKNPKKYKKINDECSICIQINDNYWIKTICNHEFHFDCLKEWRKYSMICPYCRYFLESI